MPAMFLDHHEGSNKHCLTQPGLKLHKDAIALLRPMFMEHCKAGFVAPEIGHVMTQAIEALVTEGALGLTE